jgi:thiol-disulfide isomerase/thioredoxin
MKSIILSLFFVPLFTIGQQATIHFDIKNSKAKNIEFSLYGDYTNPKVLYGDSYIFVPMENGKTDWTYEVTKPVTVKAYLQTKDSLNQLEYSFFLTSGDELYVTGDEQNLLATIEIKGKGSENNQPLIQSLHDDFIQTLYTNYRNDTLPYRILKTIQNKDSLNRLLLSKYISKYQPTVDFIKDETAYNQYFTIMNYCQLKGNQKYNVGKGYSRNEKYWQNIEDSIILINPINNDTVLSITDYATFIDNYILRHKENIWYNPQREKEYTTSEGINELLKNDKENILRELIIDKHFTGKTADFLYATIFQESTNAKEDNLPEIFERFKQKYPKSIYIPYIEPRITEMIIRRKNTLTNKMILISNTDSLQSFEDVLQMVKGKSVLLDMWGTWCGPCRADLAKYSEATKKHFKDKELDYLYISNHDVTNETKWKELIAYYNLTGTHILASYSLTKDIMEKVESNGYPTYIIIKKDGTFEKYETFPMQPEELYQQIERILVKSNL